MPEELETALRKQSDAKKYFDNFPPSAQKGAFSWIVRAKREETKKNRVNEIVQLARKNLRPFTKK